MRRSVRGPGVARSRVLRRYNKTQNLSRRQTSSTTSRSPSRWASRSCYGYLFDHRHQTAAEMERQILAIARNPLMPMPVYLSVVAPLAGTASFWDDLRRGHLAPNLRLRDLDGETICHTNLADRPRGDRRFHRADVPAAVDGGGALRHPDEDAAPDRPRAQPQPDALVHHRVGEFPLLHLVERNAVAAANVRGGRRHARPPVFRAARRPVGRGPDRATSSRSG